MHPLQHHLLTLAHYNVWATDRLLSATLALSEADYQRDVGLFFGSVHGTLNHLWVGEHTLWWPRFAQGLSPKVQLNAIVEPDRAALAQRLRTGAARWPDFIVQLAEARFDGTLDYTTTRGVGQSLPFSATLAHVFNHGTHHRGQITAALTHLGAPSPELDLVFFLQQSSTPVAR
jgi:uncharacterized damage-inducible protein DinB